VAQTTVVVVCGHSYKNRGSQGRGSTLPTFEIALLHLQPASVPVKFRPAISRNVTNEAGWRRPSEVCVLRAFNLGSRCIGLCHALIPSALYARPFAVYHHQLLSMPPVVSRQSHHAATENRRPRKACASPKDRQRLVVPAAPALVAGLAKRYSSRELGELGVLNQDGVTTFDFGEWKSTVASRKNDDGTISFITIDPTNAGFEFVVGERAGKRVLIIRDGQHEYIFTEVA